MKASLSYEALHSQAESLRFQGDGYKGGERRKGLPMKAVCCFSTSTISSHSSADLFYAIESVLHSSRRRYARSEWACPRSWHQFQDDSTGPYHIHGYLRLTIMTSTFLAFVCISFHSRRSSSASWLWLGRCRLRDDMMSGTCQTSRL